MGVHCHDLQIRFGDCDPAGIVYFPRFFALFHEAMESWFDQGLGIAYADLIRRRKLGFPAVHSEAEFMRPCSFGEHLRIELWVPRLGTRSIELAYSVFGPDETEPRLRGRTVCVVMDLDESSPGFRKAVEFPPDLRETIERFGVG